jgi:hypothetical protein
MVPLTRIPSLFAAGALVALTAAGIRLVLTTRPKTWEQLALTSPYLLRRAISRRACQARLSRELHIDTAENK